MDTLFDWPVHYAYIKVKVLFLVLYTIVVMITISTSSLQCTLMTDWGLTTEKLKAAGTNIVTETIVQQYRIEALRHRLQNVGKWGNDEWPEGKSITGV